MKNLAADLEQQTESPERSRRNNMKNALEQTYLDLLKDVLKNGVYKDDRTKTGTKSVFGRQVRFDLSKGFPLLTTKKMFLRGIIIELLWFLNGDSNLQYLAQNNVHIWDDWPYKNYVARNMKHVTQEEFIEKIKTNDAFAKKWGNLGPVYGYQWRHWKKPGGGEIDQIAQVIDRIKKVPHDRRLIVSACNVSDIEEMAIAGLPPCHSLFQFYVSNGKLSCQLYQRSADLFLGVPFNIASYALLTLMVAQVCGLKPGDFVHTFGDVHIYSNHISQVKEQLKRKSFKVPKMVINPKVKNIFKFKVEDFTLVGYESHPSIKAPIAI